MKNKKPVGFWEAARKDVVISVFSLITVVLALTKSMQIIYGYGFEGSLLLVLFFMAFPTFVTAWVLSAYIGGWRPEFLRRR